MACVFTRSTSTEYCGMFERNDASTSWMAVWVLALATIALVTPCSSGHVEAAVAQLHLHGEAGIVADALDRRRRHDKDIGFGDGAERRVQTREQRPQVLAFAALAPILQDDVGHAGARQRRAVVERRDAGDGDHLRDARRLAADIADLVEHLLGALERGAVGNCTKAIM